MSRSLQSLVRGIALNRRTGDGHDAPAWAGIVSFLAIGAGAAAGYVLLVSLALSLGLPMADWVVSAICYALFIVPTYFLHRRFSFRSSVPHTEALPRYLAVQVIALALAALFSFVAYRVIGLPSVAASILVIALTSGVNFMVLKAWAFARNGARTLNVFSPKAMLNTVHGKAVFGRRRAVLAGHIAQMIPEAGTVLDLGAGDGSIARLVMDKRPDLRFEGADVLIRPQTHIPVTQYDGVTLPFADGSFDYVTIIDVLHHCDDPSAVLAEAVRVSRKGVVIKDHLLEGLLAGPTLRFMDWVGNRGHDVRLPYNYLTREESNQMFSRARCRPVAFEAHLGLYPAPASWLFERKLHYMSLMAPVRA